MPKPQRSTSAISEEMKETLIKLHKQIEAAEKMLQKMPGARSGSTEVPLLDLYQIYFEHGEAVNLKYTEDGIRVQFFVRDPQYGGHRIDKSKKLDDFPTIRRIEIAKHIPDLIRLAKTAEGEIKSAADDVSADIEQAMAEAMEDNE